MSSSTEVDSLCTGLQQLVVSKSKTKQELKAEHRSKAVLLVKLLRNDDEKENKFVVSKEQLMEAQKQFQNYFDSFDSWYAFFSQKGVKKLPVLFSPFKKGNRAIFKDQQARSKFIVDYISNNKDMELVSLDGHGRLIYSILDYAIKRESKFKTHLVEISPVTNDFHKVMFPSNIFGDSSLSVSVPEPQDILDWSTQYMKEITNPFLYLNFCGISCCRKGKQTGRERVHQFIEKWLETHKSILLSVSLRPHGFVEQFEGTLTNYGMIKQYKNLEVSQRGHFVTYLLEKN